MALVLTGIVISAAFCLLSPPFIDAAIWFFGLGMCDGDCGDLTPWHVLAACIAYGPLLLIFVFGIIWIARAPAQNSN